MTRRGKKPPGRKAVPVAENRKARFNYELLEKFEAGLQLLGTEVKSLREGGANIAEAYAEVKDGEMWLVNSHIAEFSHGNRANHEPRRHRKLLMKRREINKLGAAVQLKGLTIVPLSLYFDPRGRAKLELAIGRGKKIHDKRATDKARDWLRQKARLLRDQG
jgi:SsrA-binding protein